MNTEQPTRALSLTERWQRDNYLSRVQLWLDPMPRKRRKRVLRELKANLGAAALEEGMPAAIDDLGKPRALARQYLETEPQGRPTWYQGTFAASGVLIAWLFALIAYVFGSLNTLLSAGLTEPVDLTFFGLHLTIEAHDEFLGATFGGSLWPLLIALVATFLVFSRLWRLLRSRKSTTADDDAAHPA